MILFVIVYQQVEWNSSNESNKKQLIYQKSWFSNYFELTWEKEAALPAVAVTNLWSMIQCK